MEDKKPDKSYFEAIATLPLLISTDNGVTWTKVEVVKGTEIPELKRQEKKG